MRICLALIALSVAQVIYGAVPVGEKFISPDGKYAAAVSHGTEGYSIGIQNTTSPASLQSIEFPGPALHLEWCGDSKAIALFNHLADASYLSLIILKNGNWLKHDYVATGLISKSDELEHSYIYKIDFNKNEATAFFSYSVESWLTHDTLRSGVERLIIDLSSGRIKKTIRKRISYDEYDQLRSSATGIPD